MELFTRKPSRDPKRVREVLGKLSAELSEVLGADLVSIILYGSFGRGDKLETEHDVVNLMFVVRRVDCQSLDKIKDPILRAEKEIPLGTMTLTLEDLHSSCDVFPIKFHEMQLHHRVLWGADVLSELGISDDHLRLRCEQELKNLMLRLRAIYLHQSQTSQQLLDTLFDSARILLQGIGACLTVKTGIIPEQHADLTDSFGAEFGIVIRVLHELLSLRESAQVPAAENVKQIFDRFMQLVHDAAAAVDQMEVRA